MEQQPSPKKMITDGPVVSPSNNDDMALDVQDKTATAAIATGNVGESEPQTLSACKQIAEDGVEDMQQTKDKGKSNGLALRTSAYLKQVWKDDLNSGQLVISLFEMFGEGIMSFIPAPEMCLFL